MFAAAPQLVNDAKDWLSFVALCVGVFGSFTVAVAKWINFKLSVMLDDKFRPLETKDDEWKKEMEASIENIRVDLHLIKAQLPKRSTD